MRSSTTIAFACFVASTATFAADTNDPDITEVPAQTKPVREDVVIDTGDLDAIQKRGALRILVAGDDEPYMARTSTTQESTDADIAAELAESLNVQAETVRVELFDDLIPMLLAGKGDVIAARMTDTKLREKQIAFTRPTAVVSELVVAKKGAVDAPKSAKDLVGRTITVQASSSYRESIEALGPGIKIENAPENADEIAILHDVAAGKVALTIVDSDVFNNASAMIDGVSSLFSLSDGRQIALGVRPTNPKLKAAADAFLVQRTLTEHKTYASTGDLDEMKRRGSIRVLLRNNATSYFLYRGVQQGFDYELMKQFAKEHGLRLDVVVPPEASDVIPWLLAGKADVIATEMTVNDARAAQIAFSAPYLFTDEVLVQRAKDPPLKSLDDLAGHTIHVRRSSSYRATLDALGPKVSVHIEDVPEDQETEQVIQRVAAGELPLTIADRTIADVEINAHPGAKTTLIVKAHDAIAFGVRKENVALKRELDAFAKRSASTQSYGALKAKYFAPRPGYDAAHVDVRVTGKLSPFDDVMKKYARTYGIDWRLMAAQSYQESAFDPHAESWCGALGLFQVMPHTGRELGFKDVHAPETNIHAGIMYMAQLIDSFDAKLPFKQRVRFALAAYNAGHGHVDDARMLAKEMGLDPDRWFGNVEKAMLKLEDWRVARRMPHGWCRGSEPVKYVSDIQSRYDNWTAVLKDDVAAK